jgi:hypothetical protein
LQQLVRPFNLGGPALAINRLPPGRRTRTTALTMSRPPAKAAAGPRTAYLVLGMHRSGTSAVTQLLALAGADLPKNVMPGDEHNAKGYFEPWKIAIFNDERLRAAGSAWDDPFAYPYRPLPEADEQAWLDRAVALFDEEFPKAAWPLMKDPRATVLLPTWRRVLEARGVAARCVIPVRHPLAVAGSLRRRDGFADEKSVLVWSAYMLAAEAYTRDLPRAFVGYDALLADWRAEVARIEAAHGAPLPKLTAKSAKEIDGFLTPELRHNAVSDGLKALGWAGEIAADVFAWFEAKAAGKSPKIALLDGAAARLAERARDMGALISSTTRDLAAVRAELMEARARLEVAQAFETEARASIARLEDGWRAAQSLLDGIDAELDAALAEE